MSSDNKITFNKDASVSYMKRKLKRMGKNQTYIDSYIRGWIKVKNYKKDINICKK